MHEDLNKYLIKEYKFDEIDYRLFELIKSASWLYYHTPDDYDSLAKHMRDCPQCLEYGFGVCSYTSKLRVEMDDPMAMFADPRYITGKDFFDFAINFYSYKDHVGPGDFDERDFAASAVKLFRKYSRKNSDKKIRTRGYAQLVRKYHWECFFQGLTVGLKRGRTSHKGKSAGNTLELINLLLMMKAIRQALSEVSRV